MYCAISGEVPQEPVVSRRTGHLYEKQLVLKHIKESGTCPMTGETTSEEDFVSVQANKAVKPRPLNATSIPGMLTLFQNEWDELMLETFTLKQHLDSTRQELSQALYQHDAACRVIARLMRERDEARAMLSMLQSQGVTVPTDGAMSAPDTEAMEVSGGATETGLGEGVLEKITEKYGELTKGRKGRKPPADLSSKEDVAGYSQVASFTPHQSSKPGVTCLALLSSEASSLALTGGADKHAILTSIPSGEVLCTLKGHSKKVTAVALYENAETTRPLAFTGGADNTVKVWKPSTSTDSFSYSEATSFSTHSADVTGLTVHPTGDYLVSVSSDSSWCFLDVNRGVSLVQQNKAQGQGGEDLSPIQSGCFHPDGLILATGGSDGSVRIWDIREQANVANCSEHTGGVLSMSFNENGYMLATGGEDGCAHIWDLRKQKSLQKIEALSPKAVTSVAFDYSGVYLACGSAAGAISVSVVKEWSEMNRLEIHKKAVTGLGWTHRASSLVSCSMDRSIRVSSKAE